MEIYVETGHLIKEKDIYIILLCIPMDTAVTLYFIIVSTPSNHGYHGYHGRGDTSVSHGAIRFASLLEDQLHKSLAMLRCD